MRWKDVKKGCVERLNRGDLVLNSKQINWVLKEMKDAYDEGYDAALHRIELKLEEQGLYLI